MVIEIPDKLVTGHYSEQEIRLEVAVALFERGLLKLAPAANLAGISTLEFQTLLYARGVAVKQAYVSPETFPDQVAESDLLFAQLSMPTKKGFNFDQILHQQRYIGPNRTSLQQSIRALDVQEPLDEMLAELHP